MGTETTRPHRARRLSPGAAPRPPRRDDRAHGGRQAPGRVRRGRRRRPPARARELRGRRDRRHGHRRRCCPDGDFVLASPSTSGTTIAVCRSRPGDVPARPRRRSTPTRGRPDFFGDGGRARDGRAHVSVVAEDCCYIGADGGVRLRQHRRGANLRAEFAAGTLSSIGARPRRPTARWSSDDGHALDPRSRRSRRTRSAPRRAVARSTRRRGRHRDHEVPQRRARRERQPEEHPGRVRPVRRRAQLGASPTCPWASSATSRCSGSPVRRS